VRPVAAHVDHRLDSGSRVRAEGARQLAARIGVPFRLLISDAHAARGESREAAARRMRYRLLEVLRSELGARWVLTAHHADDQAETVLLRLAHGSGLAGLAGMATRHGAVLRPFLGLPHRKLRAAVCEAGLVPLDDPTNRDVAVPRNRFRHHLLPALGGERTAFGARALGLAAGTLAARIERRLVAVIPELAASVAAPGVPLDLLRRLPAELLPWALALLHRRSGVEYPPRAVAVAELRRQLYRCDRVHCDCGGGWRWRTDSTGRLRVEPSPFTYTVEVREGVEISEAGTTVRSSQPRVAAVMRRGAPGGAALDHPQSATTETR